MTILRPARNLLLLLREHGRIAGLAFVAGTVLWLTIGTFAPKRYTGSALLALNPQTLPASPQDPGAAQRPNDAMAAQLRQTEAHLDWAGIAGRYHPYPEIQVESGPVRIAAYLASQVSIAPFATPNGAAIARIDYTGSDRGVVLGIVDDVAAAFVTQTVSVDRPITTAVVAPLYAPVVLPPVAPAVPPPPVKAIRARSLRRGRAARRHGRAPHAPVSPAAVDTVAVSAALHASLTAGVKLQDAFNENAATLDGLRDELNERQKRAQSAAIAAAQPKSPAPNMVRKPTPQEERLRQDLAKAQRELGALRDRYTDEYPDVVTATQRVHDLLLDISRISATTPKPARTPAAPVPAAKPMAAPDLTALLAQVSEAEAAQTRFQEAIEHNQSVTASLQAKLAAASHAPVSATAEDGASGEDDPSLDPLPAQASDPSAAPANPPDNLPDNLSGGPDAAPPASAAAVVFAPFSLIRGPQITTRPVLFATVLLWPLSLVFGSLAALLAAWLAERRDPSIRNEIMLRHELPASAVYLGGIPRIRHEVIAD